MVSWPRPLGLRWSMSFLDGVSRGLNLNFKSVGGRSLKLTDYYRAEARRYLPDPEPRLRQKLWGRAEAAAVRSRPRQDFVTPINRLKWFSCLFCGASQEISCKNIKSMRGAHFTILSASPCAAEFYEIWHTRSALRHNHVCQIFSQSVKGLRISDTPKLPSPIDLLRRPYNNVRTCTAVRHCDRWRYLDVSNTAANKLASIVDGEL